MRATRIDLDGEGGINKDLSIICFVRKSHPCNEVQRYLLDISLGRSDDKVHLLQHDALAVRTGDGLNLVRLLLHPDFKQTVFLHFG